MEIRDHVGAPDAVDRFLFNGCEQPALGHVSRARFTSDSQRHGWSASRVRRVGTGESNAPTTISLKPWYDRDSP